VSFKVAMNMAFGHTTIGLWVVVSFGVSRPCDVTDKHWQRAPAADDLFQNPASPPQQVTDHLPAPVASELKW